jgi:hypothetical protein
MGYRETRDLARAEHANGDGDGPRVLKARAARLASAAVRRGRADARYNQLVEAGQLTPVAEVHPNGEEGAADVAAFLEDMAAHGHPGVQRFSPAREVAVRAAAMPVEEKGRFGRRGRRGAVVDTEGVLAQNGSSNGNGAANWDTRYGYTVGSVKHPVTWTSLEETPGLLVLFTDNTLGVVPSAVNERGRIVANVYAQPMPLRADAHVTYGVYDRVDTNVLAGDEVPEGFEGQVHGSTFTDYGSLDEVLLGIAEDRDVLTQSTFSVLGAAALNGHALNGNPAAAPAHA